MNTAILHESVQKFITNNLKSDLTKLILKGSPFADISIQELANQIVAKQKSEKKLPTWFTAKNIYYPQKLSIEQCSSEITAAYKAKLIPGESLIDLTGGFGVDTFAFAAQIKAVTHCEINTDLSAIVTHNYKQLKVNNCATIAKDGLIYLSETSLKFDGIYIDPSRRNEAKGKVFLLKDCLPNVPENLDFLFSKSDTILIKNSPILDITSTIHELNFVKEIHIIAVQNEVKELLFLLEKNYTETITIQTINYQRNKEQCFNFTYSENSNAKLSTPLTYLYEPNAAILKSGGFDTISEQLDILKLHKHSHLYTSDNLLTDFPGRIFKVNFISNYDKKAVKSKLNTGKANIATRNFPKTVAQIRKETKINAGGTDYLFFTTNMDDKLIVIFCDQLFI